MANYLSSKYEILKNFYGYNSFREGQEPIIDSICGGNDVLAVMPTGAGKSVCYQIPAIMLPGITLVISPLISLMKDQVGALNQNGIRAAYLNSSLTPRQYGLALSNIRQGVYKIIYVAPERLMTDGFQELAASLDISMIAVDEAHCVSQWGHDFRPAYMGIAEFCSCLPRRPVVAAFTATATEQVKADIKKLLCLDSPYEITTGFDRPNLYFGVVDATSRLEYIRNYLLENVNRSGIIYAMTRKNVESVYNSLYAAGFAVTYYHAGLSDRERADNQDDFIKDKCRIMVATNAFGMGIDKPDVGFIIHYNMPLSMEAYYQEAGRAGRDGSDADCILLYSAADIHTAKFIIENGIEEDELLDPEECEAAKRRRYEKLEYMISYCKATECLRSCILRYFGESTPVKECGKCSSCKGDYESVDVTDIAYAVALAVDVTNERYGAAFIADFLHGVDNGRMEALGFTDERGFGLLSAIPISVIRDVISEMLDRGLLKKTEGLYPTLLLTAQYKKFKLSGKRIKIKHKSVTKKSKQVSRHSVSRIPENVDPVLYERLREYRKNEADKRNVPAYVIFTDTTLKELAWKKPQSITALLGIKGIGEEKATRYGTALISIVKSMN